MTDLAALLAAVTDDGWWIPVDRYCELYGETKEAVMTRRSKGIWRDGVESKFLKGAGLWVNLIAVNEWAAKSALRRVSAHDARETERREASG